PLFGPRAQFLDQSALLRLSDPTLPQLSSRPGAPYTLYLNFTGNKITEDFKFTRDNVSYNLNGHVTPRFDTDGDPTSFGSGEQWSIREIFERVAEDYAPFNVNVTTVRPAVMDHTVLTVAIGGKDKDLTSGQAPGAVGTFVNGGPHTVLVLSE